jgi:hypothetical protein
VPVYYIMILVEMSSLDVTIDEVSRLDGSRREMISIYNVSSRFYEFCEDSVNFMGVGLDKLGVLCIARQANKTQRHL